MQPEPTICKRRPMTVLLQDSLCVLCDKQLRLYISISFFKHLTRIKHPPLLVQA